MKQPIVILLTLVVLFAPSIFCQERDSAQLPLLTFEDLKKHGSIEGTFRIEGYVLDIYKCPPSPPGAMCKPCIPNNVVITDAAEPKDLSKISRLRIFTEKPDELEPKKKYSFTVKLKHKLPAGQTITDVDLVSFEPLK